MEKVKESLRNAEVYITDLDHRFGEMDVQKIRLEGEKDQL